MKLLFLGLIQGLTEFFPISSSGHLILIQNLFLIKQNLLLFDILLHIATLIPIFIIFNDEISKMIKFPLNNLNIKYIIALIPSAIIGITFKRIVLKYFFTLKTLGFGFIITGLILFLTKTYSHIKNKKKNLYNISILESLLIGITQGFAIIPGISRSGITIATAICLGFKNKDAIKFSFLLSIPTIIGATILQILDSFFIKQQFLSLNISNYEILIMLSSMIVASITGYISLKIMIKLLIKINNFKIFYIYLWLLGFILILVYF